MYGLIHIYDQIVEKNSDSINPHEIVIITRVFYTCVNMVTFDRIDSYSIDISKIKYCISTTYNLLYKSEITYNFYVLEKSEFSFSSENSTINTFYTKLGEENRKYFDHSLTHKEYISNMNSLFQEISKELENDSQDYLDSLQIFCESKPFYQRFNEFLNIYSQILDFFKEDKEVDKINDRELMSVLEFVLKTIGKSNIALFFSIDMKKLVQIYYETDNEFVDTIEEEFFRKHYFDYAKNLKSMYILTDFVTSVIDCIKKKNVFEEDENAVIILNNF